MKICSRRSGEGRDLTTTNRAIKRIQSGLIFLNPIQTSEIPTSLLKLLHPLVLIPAKCFFSFFTVLFSTTLYLFLSFFATCRFCPRSNVTVASLTNFCDIFMCLVSSCLLDARTRLFQLGCWPEYLHLGKTDERKPASPDEFNMIFKELYFGNMINFSCPVTNFSMTIPWNCEAHLDTVCCFCCLNHH